MSTYEVVRAKTVQEALDKSQWFPGQICRCVQVRPIANGDGTWTIVPVVEPVEQKTVQKITRSDATSPA